MGNRNVLHVCQHCGTVQATASSTAPEACVVCEAFTFSQYEPATSREEASDRTRERLTVRSATR
jgi:predicted  nucleic acid-binding Zn-ribbon protein